MNISKRFGVWGVLVGLMLWQCDVTRAESGYLVGAGMGDVTGPVAESIMMGYVDPSQKSAGLHFRLWARAFVIADAATGARVAFVSADLCHIAQAVTVKVVERLRAELGGLYDERNTLISANHTHSAPGGSSHYKLYTLSTLGYSQLNFDAIVDGITRSIVNAHRSLVPGTIRISEGELPGISRNRSPEAYVLNPAAERAAYGADTDIRMTVLRLERLDGRGVGMISWFPVHTTSMPKSNRLISGDNKGFASYLFEKWKGADYMASETFVAAFANSNAGDVSPNTAGNIDDDPEWECPFIDGFQCTKASATAQYEMARSLYEGPGEVIQGGIDYRHAHVDMSRVSVSPEFTGVEGFRSTCYAAIGLSMLAGAEDGRGVGEEGLRCSSIPAWAAPFCLRDPGGCHGEKPVAIRLGKRRTPWTPEVLPVQVLKIGNLALAAVPHEFTTMSGRRARRTVLEALAPAGVKHVILAGYANAYAGYVATPEEYQGQQYEGASTHFGEWTLPAYQQELKRLADAIRTGSTVEPGPTPRDLTGVSKLKQGGQQALFDTAPTGLDFGAVDRDAEPSYGRGEMVRASFWGGYPNHDTRYPGGFLEIQRREGAAWNTVARDWDVETRIHWDRVGLSMSRFTVEWEIPAGASPGVYRIVQRGLYLPTGGNATPYEGVSRTFEVR